MRRVDWSESALEDFAQAVAFIAGQDVAAARAVADRIDAAARQLGALPTGRPGRVHGTYEKSVPKTAYIIAHAVSGDTVTILRVIHERRDWPAGKWPR